MFRPPALCTGPEAITGLRHLTFDNSLRLMDTFSTDASFQQLLEQAKSEKNLQRIRTYLRLFEEYNSYMPRHSKRMTLNFLYELLMHREGDVRRRAARIMGRILANSGPSYRKELPADAPATAYAPHLMGYFAEAERLWDEQIQLCLHPDRKISPKHAQRIADSLKVITDSLFSACSDYDAQVMARPLLRRLSEAVEEEQGGPGERPDLCPHVRHGTGRSGRRSEHPLPPAGGPGCPPSASPFSAASGISWSKSPIRPPFWSRF